MLVAQADMATCKCNVRYLVRSGKHPLDPSISGFDPKQTFVPRADQDVVSGLVRAGYERSEAVTTNNSYAQRRFNADLAVRAPRSYRHNRRRPLSGF
jgi:hypothetical protein